MSLRSVQISFCRHLQDRLGKKKKKKSPAGSEQEAPHCEMDSVFVLLLHNRFSKGKCSPKKIQTNMTS